MLTAKFCCAFSCTHAGLASLEASLPSRTLCTYLRSCLIGLLDHFGFGKVAMPNADCCVIYSLQLADSALPIILLFRPAVLAADTILNLCLMQKNQIVDTYGVNCQVQPKTVVEVTRLQKQPHSRLQPSKKPVQVKAAKQGAQ